MKNLESCKFCAELKFLKDEHAKSSIPDISRKYSVAIVDEAFRERRCCGRCVYHNHKLNYCPECGKSLKKENRKNVKN